jgi:hypothetical protein
MLQYDEERRIGWTELVDHELLKSKIKLHTGLQMQVQVQVQPNQQPQPHYELLVTRIGYEPDVDNIEDTMLAPINSPGLQ